MSIKPRKFRRVGECRPIAPLRDTELGYVLGSHIRKGLYEPVNNDISGLLRNTYDEDNSSHRDVDALNSYRYDKFEKAVMANSTKAVEPNPAPNAGPKATPDE